MKILVGIIVFVYGLVFGSFLNCASMRIVRKEDWVHGKSHCMKCGHELGAKDLIPVLSFVISKGRCRYCKEKISVRYPVIELIFGVASLLLYLQFGTNALYGDVASGYKFIVYWILTACLLVVALTDMESMEIPDKVLLIAGITYVVYALVRVLALKEEPMQFVHHLIAGAAALIIMLFLSLLFDSVFKKESLGGGDIKLFGILGLYLGYFGAYELVLLSCVVGLIYALVVKKISNDKGGAFPFAPAICISGFILLFAEPVITSFYISFL